MTVEVAKSVIQFPVYSRYPPYLGTIHKVNTNYNIRAVHLVSEAASVKGI